MVSWCHHRVIAIVNRRLKHQGFFEAHSSCGEGADTLKRAKNHVIKIRLPWRRRGDALWRLQGVY